MKQDNLNTGKRTNPTWFWLLFSLMFFGVLVGIYGGLSLGSTSEVVTNQLSLLRDGKVTQAYYDYTSKEFQKNTSLPSFREFISLYDVLSNNKSFRYEGSSVEGDEATVIGVLVSDRMHEMRAEYQMVKDEGTWKIQSIRLQELRGGPQEDTVTQNLKNRVHDQLKVLRQDDLTDAYYGYFSKEFQSETPFGEFQDYVRSNPILTSFKNVDFKESQVVNGTGSVNLMLSSDAGEFLGEFRLKREKNEWKINSLRLILPPEVAAKKVSTDPKALAIPVREFLDALTLDKIENAYFGTARDFQEVTSLGSFETFVHTYPVLSKRDLTDIKVGNIDNGVGKLRVNLHDDEGMTVLEFKLGFDEGEWKIWGVEVLESPHHTETESIGEDKQEQNHQSLAEGLIELIQDQLQTLRHQDIAKAYYKYSSEDYLKEHTLNDFETLIDNNSIFAEYREVDFDRMVQNGPKITLKGTIKNLDYETYPIQYEMIKEYGSWKINQFSRLDREEQIAQIDEALKKEPASEVFIQESEDFDAPNSDIKKIAVGEDVDIDGIIKTPRIVLDTDTNLLFFNVFIEDGVRDAMVTLFLTHIDSGTTSPPLGTKLQEFGDAVISFSYAAPREGWPAGNYVVKVTTSDGDEHLQGFQMRKGEKERY